MMNFADGAAICQTVMKAGRHYAEFKVVDESTITMVGVISNADFLPGQPPISPQHQPVRPATAGPVRDARAQQAERLRELAGVYEGLHQTEFGYMICCGGLQRFFLWHDGSAHTDYPQACRTTSTTEISSST